MTIRCFVTHIKTEYIYGVQFSRDLYGPHVFEVEPLQPRMMRLTVEGAEEVSVPSRWNSGRETVKELGIHELQLRSVYTYDVSSATPRSITLMGGGPVPKTDGRYHKNHLVLTLDNSLGKIWLSQQHVPIPASCGQFASIANGPLGTNGRICGRNILREKELPIESLLNHGVTVHSGYSNSGYSYTSVTVNNLDKSRPGLWEFTHKPYGYSKPVYNETPDTVNQFFAQLWKCYPVIIE